MNDNKSSNNDFLAINLMETKETEKKKENSIKRENVIGQILMDNYNLEINNEVQLFQSERTTRFIEVIFSEDKNKETFLKSPLKTLLFVRTQSNMTLNATLFGHNYEIQISKTFCNIKCDTIYCQNYDAEESTKVSQGGSNASNTSKNSKKSGGSNFAMAPKYFYENSDKITRYIMIRERTHEIDGTFKAREDICNLSELYDIMIYPKNERNNEIKKNDRIIIEVKQNATLFATFTQMKNYMDDMSKLFKNIKFHYFAFIKDTNFDLIKDNKTINLDEFIKDVENTEKKFNDFRIYIFVIKNNQLLHQSLEEQLEYGTHYYHLTNLQFNQIEGKINEMEGKINQMDGKINQMDGKINQMDGKINEMDETIKEIKEKIDKFEENFESINRTLKNLSLNLAKKDRTDFNRGKDNYFKNRSSYNYHYNRGKSNYRNDYYSDNYRDFNQVRKNGRGNYRRFFFNSGRPHYY